MRRAGQSARPGPGASRITSKKAAQLATHRAMTPTESSVSESGSTPSRVTVSVVGLKPVSPHKAAGMRIEPPVSVPIATGAMPNATETAARSEEHTSELQSLMRISYAVFCLKKKIENEQQAYGT